jgi:hypothetical protein
MLPLTDRPIAALAATVLAGALILAAPAQAQAPQGQTAPAPTQAAPKAPAKAAKKPTDRVEARIAELHTKLKITPEQEPKWTEVAQVMRDNAKHMDEMYKRRSATLRTMTAVDDLKSYRDFTEAHAQGLQKLITAFEGLYDSMTPEQKKNADTVFAQSYGSGRVTRAKTVKGS